MTAVQRVKGVIAGFRERLARGDEAGQALVEYALLVAAVVTLVVSVMLLFGPAVRDLFEQVEDKVAAYIDGADSGGQGGNNGGGNGNGNNGNGNGNGGGDGSNGGGNGNGNNGNGGGNGGNGNGKGK